MKLRKVFVRTVLIACSFALVSAGAADRVPLSTGGLQRSPINPEYQQYLLEKARGIAPVETEGGYVLGDLPPVKKLPNVRGRRTVDPDFAPPTAYDLRTENGVTAIRDQGNCGSCWAFGTYSSLESNLKFKYAETRDFSEQHLNKKHGFDYKACAGGQQWMATAYLTRWSGPFDESKMPYPYANPEIDQANPVQKHIQNVWFLPDRTGYTDNDLIKEAVMTYGSLKVSMYWSNGAWSYQHNSHYYTGSSTGTNHAVAVIGWDDNFSATNFVTPAPGNGAFLIRNSWGASFGLQGYFWISYYDKNIRYFVGYYDAEPATNYTKNYQYDPLGNVYDYGYGTETAYGANIFKAAGKPHNTILAVGFWVLVPDTEVEISIYDKVLAANPTSGTQVGATHKVTIERAGFATVELPTPAVVTKGKKFSVVVKFKTPGYNYPVPTEGYADGYSSKATAKKNQSFMSEDGTTWEDFFLFDRAYKGNVCIKAYAGTAL